jgi:hypothetical protein
MMYGGDGFILLTVTDVVIQVFCPRHLKAKGRLLRHGATI